MNLIKVVGIDPGLANTGVAVVSGLGGEIKSFKYGVIRTKANQPAAHRLFAIYNDVRDTLKKEAPDLMVIEDIFSLGRYPKSAIILGKVVGAIMVAGWENKVEIMEVAVREAKKILTGNGAASKDQLERAVRARLGQAGRIRPAHASDALALAMTGIYRAWPAGL